MIAGGRAAARTSRTARGAKSAPPVFITIVVQYLYRIINALYIHTRFIAIVVEYL